MKHSPEEEIMLESNTGIAMFYDLKPRPPGRNIKPQDGAKGYFIQVTREDILNQSLELKAGSFILVYKVKLFC